MHTTQLWPAGSHCVAYVRMSQSVAALHATDFENTIYTSDKLWYNTRDVLLLNGCVSGPITDILRSQRCEDLNYVLGWGCAVKNLCK